MRKAFEKRVYYSIIKPQIFASQFLDLTKIGKSSKSKRRKKNFEKIFKTKKQRKFEEKNIKVRFRQSRGNNRHHQGEPKFYEHNYSNRYDRLAKPMFNTMYEKHLIGLEKHRKIYTKN